MPYVVLISQLCLHVQVPLFLDETPSPALGVVTIDRKRDVDTPKVKRKRMHAFDCPKGSFSPSFVQSPRAPDLNIPHPEASGQTSSDIPLREASPPPTYSKPSGLHKLVEMNNSHKSQLQKLETSRERSLLQTPDGI
ncbi:hypothetical protein HAX54_006092 [Datura stramonium]|uniref:Uncharacterized protein n=1 Tax=Datura stramonium TaxID=4076 RepID=A0ABS8T9Q4_DATST|nr:hypothetical protein [Datura stramonium]